MVYDLPLLPTKADTLHFRGPNWIHGSADNPISHLAQQTGTQLHAWNEDAQCLIEPDGTPVSAEEADEYGRIIWDNGLIAEAFKHSNEKHKEIDPQRSVYDFFAEKAENLFTDLPVEEAKRKREILLLVTRMWGAYIGSPVWRQSLKFFWLEECIEGDNSFVAGTYRKILDAVAKPAREQADIKLNTVVNSIQNGDDLGLNPNGKPTIATAGGARHEFDEVVVTAPLGWLKRNKAAFQPSLPAQLSQAINNIGYGTLDKVYLTFPSAFWDNSPPPAVQSTMSGPLGPSSTTPKVTATTTPIHQAPSAQNSDKPPRLGFIHWVSPAYASDTNPERWDPQAMNLADLPEGCAHPTLIIYIYGECSKYIADMVYDATSDADRDAKLIEFFQPYISRLPNYDPSNPDCKPKAVLATAWANDEFAGYGSYANFQVGLEKGDEDIEVMRQGMPERGVWLAGEHTAPFIALGTSTGAWWSGEGVGKRILEAYGLGEAKGNS
jgi:hypothetical protein